MIHKTIEAKPNQRVFVVTDVHGHFNELNNGLQKLNYNDREDLLISLGDLIDRGPESMKTLNMFMCDKTGLKHSLIGNHEKFIVDKDFDNHLYNGGGWLLNELPELTDRVALGRLIESKFSYCMTLKTGHKTYGLVHAAVPLEFESWNDFVEAIDHSKTLQTESVWQREFVEYSGSKYYNQQFVSSVDFTIHGHTPVMEKELIVANRIHIDLGLAYKKYGYGKLCILELTNGIEQFNIFDIDDLRE